MGNYNLQCYRRGVVQTDVIITEFNCTSLPTETPTAKYSVKNNDVKTFHDPIGLYKCMEELSLFPISYIHESV